MASGSGRIVIIGAGMGGLVAAALLAARGREVLVLDRAPVAGGKVRQVTVGGAAVEAGPALLTLPEVFRAVFDAAGGSLDAEVALHPQPLLARHLWTDGARLDLFADAARSADSVGAFAGAAASRGYAAFRERARRIYQALEGPYLHAQRPGAIELAAKAGLRGLLGASPFSTLWDALGEHFADPRLRQAFARVATYVGSSPMQAPATLMLIAHVEHLGVFAVEGGMARLVAALEGLARRHGAAFRLGTPAAEILAAGGRASGVRLADGEVLPAATVVAACDAAALGAGRLGAAAARAVDALPAARRSFSAVTWAMRAKVSGVQPALQTVCHPADAAAEYADLGYRARLPAAPTVTLWAQDRAAGAATPEGAERLLAMVSAPARADTRPPAAEAIAACGETAFAQLAQAGLAVGRDAAAEIVIGPAEFERLHPGSGGALYGAAVHGLQAAFSRPGAATRLPGLYLAGGSAHPGAGVAMAALSGRLAAARILGERG